MAAEERTSAAFMRRDMERHWNIIMGTSNRGSASMFAPPPSAFVPFLNEDDSSDSSTDEDDSSDSSTDDEEASEYEEDTAGRAWAQLPLRRLFRPCCGDTAGLTDDARDASDERHTKPAETRLFAHDGMRQEEAIMERRLNDMMRSDNSNKFSPPAMSAPVQFDESAALCNNPESGSLLSHKENDRNQEESETEEFASKRKREEEPLSAFAGFAATVPSERLCWHHKKSRNESANEAGLEASDPLNWMDTECTKKTGFDHDDIDVDDMGLMVQYTNSFSESEEARSRRLEELLHQHWVSILPGRTERRLSLNLHTFNHPKIYTFNQKALQRLIDGAKELQMLTGKSKPFYRVCVDALRFQSKAVFEMVVYLVANYVDQSIRIIGWKEQAMEDVAIIGRFLQDVMSRTISIITLSVRLCAIDRSTARALQLGLESLSKRVGLRTLQLVNCKIDCQTTMDGMLGGLMRQNPGRLEILTLTYTDFEAAQLTSLTTETLLKHTRLEVLRFTPSPGALPVAIRPPSSGSLAILSIALKSHAHLKLLQCPHLQNQISVTQAL